MPGRNVLLPRHDCWDVTKKRPGQRILLLGLGLWFTISHYLASFVSGALQNLPPFMLAVFARPIPDNKRIHPVCDTWLWQQQQMQSTSTMNLCSRGRQLRMRNVQQSGFRSRAAVSSSTTARVVCAPSVSRSFGSSRRQLAIRASGQGVAHPGEVSVRRQGLHALHMTVRNLSTTSSTSMRLVVGHCPHACMLKLRHSFCCRRHTRATPSSPSTSPCRCQT